MLNAQCLDEVSVDCLKQWPRSTDIVFIVVDVFLAVGVQHIVHERSERHNVDPQQARRSVRRCASAAERHGGKIGEPSERVEDTSKCEGCIVCQLVCCHEVSKPTHGVAITDILDGALDHGATTGA